MTFCVKHDGRVESPSTPTPKNSPKPAQPNINRPIRLRDTIDTWPQRKSIQKVFLPITKKKQAPRQASAGAPPPEWNDPNEANRVKYEDMATTIDRPMLSMNVNRPRIAMDTAMKGSPCKGSRGHFDAGHA